MFRALTSTHWQIWMKSAVFERQQGQLSNALETLSTAIKKYPKFAKLYMIQGQIHQQQGNLAAARAAYTAGIKACPKDVNLWILASRLEEADKKSIKARALLDKARLANPGNDVLWAEAVGVEERSGGTAQAKTVLARGVPSSIILDTYNSPSFRDCSGQVCKNAQRRACCGLLRSGRSRGRRARRGLRTRSERQGMIHGCCAVSRDCFGRSARLRRLGTGSGVPSLPASSRATPGATSGRGGSSLNGSMGPRCVSSFSFAVAVAEDGLYAGAPRGGHREGGCCGTEVWANVAVHREGHCERSQEHTRDIGARCGCLALMLAV